MARDAACDIVTTNARLPCSIAKGIKGGGNIAVQLQDKNTCACHNELLTNNKNTNTDGGGRAHDASQVETHPACGCKGGARLPCGVHVMRWLLL